MLQLAMRSLKEHEIPDLYFHTTTKVPVEELSAREGNLHVTECIVRFFELPTDSDMLTGIKLYEL